MPAAWLKMAGIVLAVMGYLLIPIGAFAVIGIDEPLIPCGLSIDDPDSTIIETDSCTFCHFFALIQNIYNFLIFVIVPPVAVVMIAIGGFFWLTAAGSPARVQQGHKIILAVLAGLVIMYVAWLVISFGISLIAENGVVYNPAVWWKPHEWFDPQCSLPSGGITCNVGEWKCIDAGTCFLDEPACTASGCTSCALQT